MEVLCAPFTVIAIFICMFVTIEKADGIGPYIWLAVIAAVLAAGYDGAMIGAYVATHAQWVKP